ncbi:uncharacterized protein BO97DRAFT_404892 [Aspergillus homomorphus CBS 101889]|uniref:WSC domain-containing protein n=1 Tax=Aspergillus homomorphus (strain CBS 101889) TaxID=1450537 RepID=A0A395HZN7_ASPHC|nr:hypothetical protein BO97DRAFT_404892 [Aspergillus homomorphus CBS 101889]RAL13401.1 hypothetical protein BO97DRAFT_404892 [Aspergillus homomorphus CBS 101889]
MIAVSSNSLGALMLLLGSVQALHWGTYACMKSSGDMTKLGSSPYQSAGLCQNLCEKEKGSFFALQHEDCWCGSQPPAFGSMGGVCEDDCPGFPEDKCGGDGAYSVWELEDDYSNPSLQTSTSTALVSKAIASSSTGIPVVASASASVTPSSAATPSATTPVTPAVHTNSASRRFRILFF